LATGSSDGSIQLWNVEQSNPIRELPGHEDGIMGMVFTPDGQTLISGSADGFVKLWDMNTGSQRASWRAQELDKGFSCLACSPDGATLATGNLNRTIKIWDLATHEERFTLPESGGVRAMSFADGGNKLVVANGQGGITIWDCGSQQTIESLEGTEWPVLSMAATADGKKLIAGSLEGSVNLWELDAGHTRRTLEKDGMWVKATAFSPDGTKFAFAHNMDFSVRVWELVPSSSK